MAPTRSESAPAAAPAKPIRSVAGWYAAVVVATVVLGVYALTLAPGPVDEGDSGELLAAAATWGVPHPSGYPVYAILAGIAYRLPVPGLLPSQTVACLSAVAAAFAALLGVLFLDRFKVPVPWAAVGGALLALHPLIWSQAVMAEVYTLHLALALLLAWRLLPLLEGRAVPGDLLAVGLVAGLGLGNHLTTLLLLPLAGWAVLRWARGAAAGRGRGLGMLALGLALGLSTYLYLPLRAASVPEHSWGAPSTLARFVDHVTLKQFRGDAFRELRSAPELPAGAEPAPGTRSILATKLRVVGTLLLGPLALPGTLLAFVGLAGAIARRDRIPLTLAAGFAVYGAAVFLAFGQSSPTVLEGSMPMHFLPLLGAVAIAAGYGGGWLAGRAPRAGRWLLLTMAVIVLVMVVHGRAEVGRRGDLIVVNFAERLLCSVPQRGVLLVEGDDITFPLWYLQAAGVRPDVVVVNGTLLHFDWYRERFGGGAESDGPSVIRQLVAAAPAAYSYPEPAGWLGLESDGVKGLVWVIKPEADALNEARRVLGVLTTIDPEEFLRPTLTLRELGLRRRYAVSLNNAAIQLARGRDFETGLFFMSLARRLEPDDAELRGNERQLRDSVPVLPAR